MFFLDGRKAATRVPSEGRVIVREEGSRGLLILLYDVIFTCCHFGVLRRIDVH
jgi:hypothetical protein